ncbi:MAG: glucose-6-phosphate dehydrogenase [Candidatus Xenobia bacterium]
MESTHSLENPLAEPLFGERTPDPCSIVIFGATGDLTRRKLVPALYDQFVEQHMPVRFSIIGSGRTPLSDDAFREEMHAAVQVFARNAADGRAWGSFSRTLSYVTLDEGTYIERMRAVSASRDCEDNWLWYMTTPPDATLRILRALWRAGLASGRTPAGEQPWDERSRGWTRVILEKPFGHSLEEARQLNAAVSELFHEEQIFRIDHYLGKEAVQNILVFRFANRIFEPVWNNRDVDHVEITVAETVGVENRASYYETAGALKDMVQNHLLQLLALVAMEPPAQFAADVVRDEKVKVLRAIRRIRRDDAVRAQYTGGFIEGKPVPGYREEPGVRPDSAIATYVAVRVMVDTWRWAGVPFYIRTGKRLAKRVSEIAVQFRRVPHLLFGATPADQVEPNMLVMRIQPDDGITLRFEAKLPGTALRLRSLNMDFHYGTAFGHAPPEAYERLLLDCMVGDSTLFSRKDAVDASWEAVTPLVDAWARDVPPEMPGYEAGTWGPQVADQLMERDGRRWRRL